MNLYLVTTRLPAAPFAANGFVVRAKTARSARNLTLPYWGDYSIFDDEWRQRNLLDTLFARQITALNSDPEAIVLRSFGPGDTRLVLLQFEG